LAIDQSRSAKRVFTAEQFCKLFQTTCKAVCCRTILQPLYALQVAFFMQDAEPRNGDETEIYWHNGINI